MHYMIYRGDDDERLRPLEEASVCILSGEWANCRSNAEAAVQDVVESFFDDVEWDDIFGTGTGGSVIVVVSKPEAISGKYDVVLNRPVKAHAHRSVS